MVMCFDVQCSAFLSSVDETPVQVLGEPGRENTQHSTMWLARGGPPDSPMCLYYYTPTHSAQYPRELLGKYQGYVQTDGYSAYAKLAEEHLDLTLVGCWAHARRTFVEAAKGSESRHRTRGGLEDQEALPHRAEAAHRAPPRRCVYYHAVRARRTGTLRAQPVASEEERTGRSPIIGGTRCATRSRTGDSVSAIWITPG